MKQLNREQTLAVQHVDGPMLVLAGPGSGKTTVLTERIRFLIEQKNISPEHILVLTFSKKAALEMQQRFYKLMRDCIYPVSFGTFHAVFFHILRQYHSCLAQSVFTPNIKKEYISEEGIPDFESMVMDCRTLLLENPEQRKKWQEKYRYILVDEFQDSNEAQYEILKLLAGNRANLFCVGDEDQAIYGFRGAAPQIMQRLLTEYPTCSCVELSTGYRCSEAIICAANSLICHNTNRIKAGGWQSYTANEKMKYRTRKLMELTGITARIFETKEAEADFVLDELKMLMKSSSNTGKPVNAAVLYRLFSCADLLEEKLLLTGIPYEKNEKQKGFYQEDWVQDILAYLRLSVGEMERTHLYRILNRPRRTLSRECVSAEEPDFSKMFSYYKDAPEQTENLNRLQSDLKLISTLTPFAAVTYILKGVGYGRYLKQKFLQKGIDETEADDLAVDLLDRSRKFKTIHEWLFYIEDLEAAGICVQPAVKCVKECMPGQGKIVLQTMHASKGLEYDVVFVIGLRKGILPHKKADTTEKIEEERRLLYVAMTRAKTRLYLCAQGNLKTNRGISEFTKEICCQFH